MYFGSIAAIFSKESNFLIYLTGLTGGYSPHEIFSGSGVSFSAGCLLKSFAASSLFWIVHVLPPTSGISAMIFQKFFMRLFVCTLVFRGIPDFGILFKCFVVTKNYFRLAVSRKSKSCNIRLFLILTLPIGVPIGMVLVLHDELHKLKKDKFLVTT